MRAALLGFCLVLPATAAQAQTDDACAKFKWPIAREQKAFSGGDLPVVKDGAQYPGAMTGVTLALSPQAQVTYPQPSGHKAKSSSPNGAVIATPPLPAGGTYQITLSGEAWIDPVQNGKIIRSSAYSGAEGCPGVRKSVRFKFDAGPLTIEISDAKADRINLDLLPVE